LSSFHRIIDDKMRLKCEQVGSDAQLSKPQIGKLVSVIDGLIEAEANSWNVTKPPNLEWFGGFDMDRDKRIRLGCYKM
jgi:hypothetical protein